MKAVIFNPTTPIGGSYRVGVECTNHNGTAVILASVGVSDPFRAVDVRNKLRSLIEKADWRHGAPNCRVYHQQLSQSLCLKAAR